MVYFKTLLFGDTVSNELEEVTIDKGSFSFGTVAPGETSSPLIIAFKCFETSEIGNIRFALTNTGDITFANNIFGIATSSEINSNLSVSTYFQGVNSTKDELSAYNISIPNAGEKISEYVYLTINLPNDMLTQIGVIRYKWFFDYYDGGFTASKKTTGGGTTTATTTSSSGGSTTTTTTSSGGGTTTTTTSSSGGGTTTTTTTSSGGGGTTTTTTSSGGGGTTTATTPTTTTTTTTPATPIPPTTTPTTTTTTTTPLDCEVFCTSLGYLSEWERWLVPPIGYELKSTSVESCTCYYWSPIG